MLPQHISEKLHHGCVIPAHPLALTDGSALDERRQRTLTRYYLAAGAGGLAVGVHTTQFAIHDDKIGLYEPVLELAVKTATQFCDSGDCTPPIMIAGIVGETKQAIREAELARGLGYHVGLLSLTALRGKSIDDIVEHARQIGQVIPIMGFYLQQAISGMSLPPALWEKLVELPSLVGIKIAPFNRYQSLDVLEAVAHCGRADQIALYTGNDDHIILDLLTKYTFNVNGESVSLRIAGGLLGQWACWTKKAVECLDQIKCLCQNDEPIPKDILTLANQLTLANKAIFDADNNFTGCIPGISYVLKSQGLLQNTNVLDPNDRLSSDQASQIDQIIRDYPHLTDDDFVRQNLDSWL